MNRLTQKLYPDSTTVNYTYDNDSRLTQVALTGKCSVFKGHTSALAFALLLVGSSLAYGQDKSTFSMPDSVLFFWDEGQRLQLVTTTDESSLALPSYPGPWSHPVVARHGSRVTSGLHADSPPIANRLTLGVFSFPQREWKAYENFAEIGVPGISPDGNRTAFVAKKIGEHDAFWILDIPSGTTTPVNQLASAERGDGPSWSPDGKRLAVAVKGEQGGTSAIEVYELNTSKVTVVGEGGGAPVWSPNGEWIAYFETAEKCALMHPDGTGAKVVRNLGGLLKPYRAFKYSAVWSPDGKQLLLNELKGEGPNIDVMLVDLETGAVTRKSHNGLAVIGWTTQEP